MIWQLKFRHLNHHSLMNFAFFHVSLMKNRISSAILWQKIVLFSTILWRNIAFSRGLLTKIGLSQRSFYETRLFLRCFDENMIFVFGVFWRKLCFCFRNTLTKFAGFLKTHIKKSCFFSAIFWRNLRSFSDSLSKLAFYLRSFYIFFFEIP